MYRQRIMQILSPIVGEANVLSQVNMSLDFTQTEITTEDYDSREKGPKTRSEVVSEDKKSGKESEAACQAPCPIHHHLRLRPALTPKPRQRLAPRVQKKQPPPHVPRATMNLTVLCAM